MSYAEVFGQAYQIGERDDAEEKPPRTVEELFEALHIPESYAPADVVQNMYLHGRAATPFNEINPRHPPGWTPPAEE